MDPITMGTVAAIIGIIGSAYCLWVWYDAGKRRDFRMLIAILENVSPTKEEQVFEGAYPK